MQAFTDARGPDTPDELWVLEHDPVFTLGQAGKWEHVLLPGEIPVVPVDRGEKELEALLGPDPVHELPQSETAPAVAPGE